MANFGATSSICDIPENSLHISRSKTLLKNAVVAFEALCIENDMIATEASTDIPHEATVIGKVIFELVLELMSENQLVNEEELLHCNESSPDPLNPDLTEASSSESSEEILSEPESKKAKIDYVPIDTKIKTVNLAKQNPGWSLTTLRKKGCSALKRKDHLKRWEAEILEGGSDIEKFSIIDSWTYARFPEARQQYQQVTTRNLQQWALAAAGQFDGFNFKASDSWVQRFNLKHKIRQRKVTKFVSTEEVFSLEDIINAADKFSLEAKQLIPNFSPEFVINTDQRGCQYQSLYNRTLTEKGSKLVFVSTKDMNKVTHSYTAQYSITLSGSILPKAFICLQEASGDFGPRVQKQIDELTEKYTNIQVFSSKSCKLTTNIYKKYLQHCLKPYVKDNRFLLLIDSWRVQNKIELYDEEFQDSNNLPTCTLKVIPPKCTPLVQPCDVYFYRQVKNFIKRIQNCSTLVETNRELTAREDCIKIHSLIQHQLSAPIFRKMILYAWHAAKLLSEKEVFMNVNEVCFGLNN